MPAPSCCVLIPVGPGHATLAHEARASVEQAAGFSNGPFQSVEVTFLDDSDGSFGRSRRRNDGVAYASGQGFDWLFFLDADDLMALNAFTEAATYISDHDAIWGAIWITRDGRVEDFKYYLEVWRRYRCIKIDRPLFFNRRGCHSTGPRSASGPMWRQAVERVIADFRLAGNIPMA